MKDVSFSPTNVGSHTPPFGATSLLALVPFSNRCGTPQFTLFGAQRPFWHTASYPPPLGAQPSRWHIAWCLVLIPFITAQTAANRYCSIWTFPYGFSLKVFKTHLLGRDFHTLIKNVSFSSPTDVRSHPLSLTLLV